MNAQAPTGLDPAACHRAVASRDARFDGRFFTAVRTTGIYCRPPCPARTPRLENVSFYRSAAAAEQAGYRPCRRCRPETAPGSAAWLGTATTVSRALRLIEQGALDHDSVERLAERLGVGGRHLRRLLLAHVGATPVALAQTRRLHFARRLLVETSLPVASIASAAGFGSQRRMNASFRAAFGSAPRAFRKVRSTRAAMPPTEDDARIELVLTCRPPFASAPLLAFLAPRRLEGAEMADPRGWAGTCRIGEAEGVVEILLERDRPAVRLRAPVAFAPHVLELVTRARRLLDLDADPKAIRERLREDAILRPLVTARPGLRVPGAWDPFASAVRTILGQQVSVAAATTLADRLVRTFGEPLRSGGRPGLDRLFPTPERLAEARMEELGVIGSRARSIRALAAAVASGDPVLTPAPDLPTALARLRTLPGIGPWTAGAIAMRALHEPDAFPHGDLALERALGSSTPREREDRLAAWSPFAAYAAMHLWVAAAAPSRRRS